MCVATKHLLRASIRWKGAKPGKTESARSYGASVPILQAYQTMGHDPEKAINDMMEKYGDATLLLCYMYLGDAFAAQDAAQDAFIRAYSAYGRFRGESAEKTWLCRIAVNVCKSYLRRRRAVPTDALPETAVYDSYDLDGTVVRAVSALPEKYKSVVLLRFYRELSTKETSAALGISENAVTTRLMRAKAMLKEKLEDYYYDE